MSVTTLGDMLDRVEDFEQRLVALYSSVRDGTTNDGTRLLTYYLARHRRHLPAALKSCTSTQIEEIRRTPLKYDGPDFEPRALLDRVELPASATANEVLDTAVALVQTLTAVYRWMAYRQLGDEASLLFNSLLKIEETHLVELKKIRAVDYL
ncbi:MAG: hypothetical protein ACYTFI_04580 [Planctomycetota bacterium]|jgi:hypothetical protein